MQRKDSLDSLAITLLLGCCFFWGFQQVLVKATLAELPPIFQASVRFIGATALLWGWCRWRGIRLFSPDGSLRAGLLAGVLFALEFVFIYNGLMHTGAARLTVLLYTSPFWVALILPLFVKSERLHWGQWVGLLLAFAGVVLALRDGLAQGGPPGQLQGDLLALCAGLCWGLTTVVIRSSAPLAQVPAEKLLFYQVAVSSVVLPALSLGLGEAWTWDWSLRAGVSIFIQTAVGAFASFLLWMWLLGRYPATRISAFVFLTPVFALAVGALWLGEPITAGLVLALLLVTAGVFLVSRKA